MPVIARNITIFLGCMILIFAVELNATQNNQEPSSTPPSLNTLALLHPKYAPKLTTSVLPEANSQHFASRLDQLPVLPTNPQKLEDPCTAKSTQDLPWIDRTHLRLSQSLCNQVRRFDRFFGDVNYDEQYRRSFMRIRNSISWENTTETELNFRPRIRANIRLPNAEEHFNLIISDDTDDPDSLSSANETLTEDNDERNVTTAIRWIAQKSKALELNLDVGVRLNDGLDTFVRTRYRKQFSLSDTRNLRLTQNFFWRRSEGFGERTQLDLEQLFSPQLIGRWTSGGTFSENSQGVEWIQRLTLLQRIDAKRAVAYSLGVVGQTRPIPLVENYGVSVRYRKNIYRRWLFAEVEPVINWPLETNRETSPGITFRLEVQLGNK